MSGYYHNNEFVSNSDLTSMTRQECGVELPKNIQYIYDFGNLVDRLITDKASARDWFSITKTLQSEDYILAENLANELLKNSLVKLALPFLVFQHEIYKTVELSHNGRLFKFKARGKLDGLAKKLRLSIDYKTTKCTTIESFTNSCYSLGYHRQGAIYMTLAKTDRHLIAGVSKVNKKVFLILMVRGDDMFKSGMNAYSEKAYKWKMYFDNFK